ncbi:MAG: thiamine-phosphate kinase [Marinifilaceae bacterium]|jgi:thiamine-monophosphate kinase|nr:thiamine-phosphate kinase [Marinifilaceae bacterium]
MDKENSNKKQLSDLGEFGLISHLTKNIELKNNSSQKGVGDDAAVLDYKNKKTLISTDMLVEGIHFDLTYTPLKHLGYKAVASNVSDICAMNGIAKQIVISIALDKRFSLEMIEEIYEGIHAACDKYGVDIVGGDTTSSLTGLSISITVLGEAEDEEITYRNGAKENDLICVSGDLGGAYMGLQLLEREKNIFLDNPNIQPDLEGHDYIVERQLKPEARQDIVKLLKSKDIKPNSMIDISDGLASEVLHICEDSNLGCSLFEEKIPIDYQTHKMAEEFNINSTVAALNGGEDYELLFTVPLDKHDIISSIPNVTIVGHINSDRNEKNLITRDGTKIELQAQGWCNFKE